MKANCKEIKKDRCFQSFEETVMIKRATQSISIFFNETLWVILIILLRFKIKSINLSDSFDIFHNNI